MAEPSDRASIDVNREPPWVMRQIVGFGTPAQTHEQLTLLRGQGQTELALAFDEPTRMGLDSDSPRALGEVGMTGVAIDTVDDLDVVLHHVPLDQVAVHLGIDGPGVVLLGFYLALADERGVARAALAGSVQNDCFREFLVPRGWVAPPAGALRLVGDVITFCERELPRWSPVSIDGHALREAGATAAHEIAFALAAALACLETGAARGAGVEQVAPRLSLLLDVHHDFFEEIAKFRAARSLWSRLLTERHGPLPATSLDLRLHARTSTVLTTQTPRVNVVRAALQSLAAVLGGARSLHTATRDEATSPPGEADVLLAVRTQQLLADECGVAPSFDPLAGSPLLERLTAQLESEALAHLRRIDQHGGLVASLAQGFPQRELAVAGHQQQRQIEQRRRVLVGVNRHTEPSPDSPESLPLPIDDEVQRRQQNALAQVKATRDASQVAACLEQVREAAEGSANVLTPIIAAARARCTLGEICDVLRGVLGTHDEESEFLKDHEAEDLLSVCCLVAPSRVSGRVVWGAVTRLGSHAALRDVLRRDLPVGHGVDRLGRTGNLGPRVTRVGDLVGVLLDGVRSADAAWVGRGAHGVAPDQTARRRPEAPTANITASAPSTLPIRPAVLNSSSEWLVKRLPTAPPTNEPTTPRMAVIPRPMLCRPGMMARAMRPTTRPKTRKRMMPMTILLERVGREKRGLSG